jgi:hypothetical protein
MTKRYVWKLFKNGELREIETQGPYYDNYRVFEGPFDSIEEAEAELEAYFNRYFKDYECNSREEFVLLTVYSN